MNLISKAGVLQRGDTVELWGVIGVSRSWFITKLEAETAARRLFPDDTAVQQYARLFFIQSEPYGS